MRFYGNRRYNSFVGFFREKYGNRLQKIVVDAGFTCPNRDGTIASGGCTYCDNEAFHPSYSTADKDIILQLNEGIEFHTRRYRRAEKYLAYFQPYSNTYGTVSHLRNLYNKALSHPLVAGIVIGTRPDCVDKDIIDLLAELSEKHIVIVEYGIESIHDTTLKRINRGHNITKAIEAINLTREAGLMQGAHFIFGLPGESREDMMQYAQFINENPILSVKFHQLQIVRGTAMEREHKDLPGDFVKMSLEEYIDFFIDFLEILRPNVYIERFAGEVPPRFTENNPWGLVRYTTMQRMLEKRAEERDTFQSRLFIG